MASGYLTNCPRVQHQEQLYEMLSEYIPRTNATDIMDCEQVDIAPFAALLS